MPSRCPDAIATALALCGLGAAAIHAAEPPAKWIPAGVGGGGALFSPSWSPHNASELWVACDMSQLFRTTDLGGVWQTISFREIQGNRGANVQFTSDPNILWSLDYTSPAGSDSWRPSRSLDAGQTWTPLAADPTSAAAEALFADPDNSQRALINDYDTLYFTNDGGASWTNKYSTGSGSGLRLAGCFWDGATIYAATNLGVLLSANNGASFTLQPANGIPAGEAIVSFCGARSATTVRLFAVTEPAAIIYNGITVEELYNDGGTRQIYRMNVGSGGWALKNSGITAGHRIAFIGCARNDINTVYAAGELPSDFPVVYKSINGADSWTSALQMTNNANVATGWAGDGGDRQWSYGGRIMSLGVAPNNSARAAFSDYGFVHVTTDAAATWRQAYVSAATQNPAGAPTPKGHSYRSVGLEDTTCWQVHWPAVNKLICCNSDIKGTQSIDGGVTWNFNYSGHGENSMYRIVEHPNGTLYAATSGQHDIYQSTTLTDSRLDNATGRVLYSTNDGAKWELLHDFAHPVIWVALDPNNSNRLYAAVIHYANGSSPQGGIWRSDNINLGSASTWTKLANPPRTQGHPFNIHVLNDGALVASYSARRDSTPSSAFTASSGVFYIAPDSSTWLDRSHGNQQYWTKDLVISPHDPTQNTWYAAVFNGWGGLPNDKGGLYRTTNRGQNWTRLNDNDDAPSGLMNVESCTPHPTNPAILYFTTELDGLWWTQNADAAFPTFAQVTSYPFKQPTRVFFRPGDPSEMWVTSFGHGMYAGLTPYAAWKWEKFAASRDDPNTAGDLADFDKDGVPTLVEYALTLDPTKADAALLPQAQIAGNTFQFTYSVPTDRTDITCLVETSTNLNAWQGAADSVINTSNGLNTWQASVPQSGALHRYFRLRITRNN